MSSVQHLEFRRDPFKQRQRSKPLPARLMPTVLPSLPENSLFGQGCTSRQQHSRKTDKKVPALLFAAIVPPAEGGGLISRIPRMSRTCDITTRKRSGFLFLVGRTALVCSPGEEADGSLPQLRASLLGSTASTVSVSVPRASGTREVVHQLRLLM